MKFLIFLLSIFATNVCFAKDEELHLSNIVLMEFELPQKLSHSGNLLILKFEDWHFSHEVINPKEFYKPIDLTGIQHEFLKSVFYPKLREKLPGWLGELANEQAASFGLPKSKIIHRQFDGFELLGIYDQMLMQGNVFIFEEYQIHHLSFHGENLDYINLINGIKEK